MSTLGEIEMGMENGWRGVMDEENGGEEWDTTPGLDGATITSTSLRP